MFYCFFFLTLADKCIQFASPLSSTYQCFLFVCLFDLILYVLVNNLSVT